jgi:lipoate-protein ligase A
MLGEVWIDVPQLGSWNMAMDQAMLEYAAATQQVILRCYRWSKPTISLGYFQSYDNLADKPSLCSLDCVRRLTGGGALLHDQEITYSIGVPGNIQNGNIQNKGHNEQLYRATHRGLVVWLKSLGFQANLWEDANRETAQAYPGESPFWCFERRSDVDIVVGERKVLGSAQRRNAYGLLQHGSLLIEASNWTPWLPGIIGNDPDQQIETFKDQFTSKQLGETLREVLGKVLDCDWRAGAPSQVVLERAKTIDTERFSSLEWTRHRNRLK